MIIGLGIGQFFRYDMCIDIKMIDIRYISWYFNKYESLPFLSAGLILALSKSSI